MYVGLENIERGGRLISVRSVGVAGLASTKFMFTAADVLFGKLRPNLAKIARPSFNGVCSTDILPLTPGKRLDRGYLAHYLLQPSIVAHGAARASGANLPRLSPSQLALCELPLPPIEEQRRIADILDRAEALRAQRAAAPVHLDEMERSTFLEMFVRGESRSWPVLQVQTLAASTKGSIRTGPFGSQLLHSEFTADGVAVLGIDNVVRNQFNLDSRRFISEEKYRQLARYTVHPGDVLITIMGTCGRCAVVPDGIPRAINTKHLCCISLDHRHALPDFLNAYFLMHPRARSHLDSNTKGAIMAGLNMSIIKSMPVAGPRPGPRQSRVLGCVVR